MTGGRFTCVAVERLMFLELFPGQQEPCIHHRRFNFAAIGLDLVQHPFYQNIMSGIGLLNMLSYVMMLVPHESWMWMGIVCSTWIWLCRWSVQRSEERPEGNEDSALVKHANVMVSRAALLQRLGWSRFIKNCLEQPHSSILMCMGRMRWNCSWLMDFDVLFTFLGSFGSDTSKAIKLYHDTEFVPDLQRDDHLKKTSGNLNILCDVDNTTG